MKGKLLSIVCFLLLAAVSEAKSCIFSWDIPTKYTDGTPITEPITYRLYYIPVGATVAQKIAEQTAITTPSLLCPAGTYYATAFTPTTAESAKSNILTLK